MDMREYLTSLQGSREYPELVDLLAADGSADSVMKMSISYPPHLTVEEIGAGLRAGDLIREFYAVKGGGGGENDDWVDCYSVIHSSSGGTRRSVAIKGEYRVNRALDGDVVAMKVVSAAPSGEETAFLRGLAKYKAFLNKRTNGCDDGGSNHGFIGEGTLAVSNEILEGITEEAWQKSKKNMKKTK